MKKKLILTGMILLALVVTSGTFAYTYTGHDLIALGANIIDEAMATYEPAEGQPEWDDVLPESDYGSEILIPVTAGDNTELPTQYPASGQHWDKVDDLPTDEGATYVSTLSSKQWEKDLYHLTNAVDGEGIIGSVIVYFRFAAGGDYNVRAMAEIKTNGVVFSGPTETQHGTEFVTRSYNLTVNPATDEPWTWDEINDLQAGVTMKGQNKNKPALCTQVYVQVDYEIPPILDGLVPEGELFIITPHADYTGDLLVTVYLTNTGPLSLAFKYLNMKVYIANSLEAGETPDYQMLTFENGVALFGIDGGAAASYTVEIIGGSYRLVSGDTSQWGEEWTVTPEFYCEVTQR